MATVQDVQERKKSYRLYILLNLRRPHEDDILQFHQALPSGDNVSQLAKQAGVSMLLNEKGETYCGN